MKKAIQIIYKKTLALFKSSSIVDQGDIIRDIYQYILKLHLYSPELFTEQARSFLSEQDYVIKSRSYLIETTFRLSEVMPHWGDTISSFLISNGSMAKIDLRLITVSPNDLKEALDLCNAEFARKETESKYYKDFLKSVISSKIHLNELVKDFPFMNQEIIQEVKMPFCIIAGTVCYVYTLRAVSRNLYIVEDVCDMSIPLSLKDLKDKGIYYLVKHLLILKDICLDIKTIVEEKEQPKEKKVSVIRKNKNKQSNIPRSNNSTNWCKDIWLPSPMSDDEGDGIL